MITGSPHLLCRRCRHISWSGGPAHIIANNRPGNVPYSRTFAGAQTPISNTHLRTIKNSQIVCNSICINSTYEPTPSFNRSSTCNPFA